MTPKTPPPVIKLKDLHKNYGFGDAITTALDGMNLTINKGEFVAIMGPSGCGKTTLLNILGLLDQPTNGEYDLSGEPVESISQSRRAQIRREQIGFVFQSFNLLPRQTVIENVALPLIYSGKSHLKRLQSASKALRLFHLQNREYYMPHQLSGGQMQRVAIARALVNEPSIILADEPTGNLDSRSSEIIMQELSEIHQRGNTIIMVTHNSRLTSYADRIIYMLDGKIDTDSKVEPKKPDLTAKIPLSAKRRKVNSSKSNKKIVPKKATKKNPAAKKTSKAKKKAAKK